MAQTYRDEDATPDQQAAIEALTSGAHGHPYYEIFSAMAPNTQETVVAPIEFACDQEQRMAHILIPDIAESEIEPIRNPVTGKEHRARIDLPNGFEYKVAEVGNSVNWHTTAGDHLTINMRTPTRNWLVSIGAPTGRPDNSQRSGLPRVR